MANYRFRFDGDGFAHRELAFDLTDASLVGYVAKQAARQMASRELVGGRLTMAHNLLVFDADNAEVARYPLSDFIALG
ncbi:MAG: hypothetical protein KDE15_08760 [Erythrobacter sp.]|nr:hypothetical protein [Erythrobacter sp.]